MSILIKGVEIPSECRMCPLCRYFYSVGVTRCMITQELLAEDYKTIQFEGRHEKCPLVELPEKHGRLVDVNALKVALIHAGQASGRYRVGETWELNFEEILDVLTESPTIVEAEGKE